MKQDKTRLLSLKQDWDGEDGVPFKEKTVDSAIEIATKIYNGMKNKILPDLIPYTEGSIDIEFSDKPFECLINIDEDGEIGYYCDNGSSECSIKGEDIDKLIGFINKIRGD